MTYIRFPIETDPTLLAQRVFNQIQMQAPAWAPNEANLDVWIIRSIAQLASENRSIASDVQDDIFRWFGANLMGIAPGESVAAHGFTTWTMIDSVGHTIPAGTAVGIRNSFGDLIPFVTMTDITVPPGNTATGAGEVIVSAIDPGIQANALGGAGQVIELIDVIDWVQSVVTTAATSGGLDEEDDPTYLSRLVVRMQRLSLRPILPPDFALLARDSDDLIARAVCIDGYNPSNQTYSNERYVAVACILDSGEAVSATIKTKTDAYLQANREINFVVAMMDPAYTTINVACTVVPLPGVVAADVKAAVEASVANYLHPANWATDPTVSEGTSSFTWIDAQVLYYNEVITVISNVLGVARVTSLTLNGGTANVNLAAPASLTRCGTNVCTVT